MKTILSFLKRNDGPTAVEYAVIIALVLAACLIGVNMFSSTTTSMFDETNQGLSTINTPSDSGDSGDTGGSGDTGDAGGTGDSGGTGAGSPGNSGNAPGQTGSPGKSGSAPGRNK